jgi:hypothetical protein
MAVYCALSRPWQYSRFYPDINQESKGWRYLELLYCYKLTPLTAQIKVYLPKQIRKLLVFDCRAQSTTHDYTVQIRIPSKPGWLNNKYCQSTSKIPSRLLYAVRRLYAASCAGACNHTHTEAPRRRLTMTMTQPQGYNLDFDGPLATSMYYDAVVSPDPFWRYVCPWS